MDSRHYLARVAQASDLKTFVIGITLSSLLLNLVFGLSLASLSASRQLRVEVSVPPTLEKSFWVQRDKASREWIEQMGLFVAQLNLNVTPSSVQYQGNIVLSLVAPAARGDIKRSVDMNVARVQRSSIATFFTPRESVFDAKNPNRVAFKGDLTTVLTDKTVNKRPITYVVAFELQDGTQRLVEAHESKGSDPLALKSLETENP